MTGSGWDSASDLIGWLGNARLRLWMVQRGLGYHPGDVDAFLDTVVEGLQRDELLDPMQVRGVQFRTVSRRGYDRQAVETLLDELQQRLGTAGLLDDRAMRSGSSAAALIETIRLARFGTTRHQGYDEQEVDAFLDNVTAALRRGDQLNTEEIRGRQFRVLRLRPGYVQRDVDDLVQRIERYASGYGL